MLRSLRWLALLTLPAFAIGIPAGVALGSFAAGEPTSGYMEGYLPPDAGAELQSASAADALQPADEAFIPEDRYTTAAQCFAD
ncbi:hypothetical protein [Sphingomonas qomolangmaensis]|uniref:Uncharacterized protein n=1 Tax=Sphingomonas qomolangmaensis TaxID=2918765 RepID=A0ABY5L3Z6_9SPHN|nr:hypothetical protein [Sphingomonas qomolangmaensis]UUL81684.1 hypothetical protein NMP03_10795 [Sphingomonas qomolangmaensis]